jgi:hypothetical protein
MANVPMARMRRGLSRVGGKGFAPVQVPTKVAPDVARLRRQALITQAKVRKATQEWLRKYGRRTR